MSNLMLELSEKLDDALHSFESVKNEETHFLQFKSDYKSAVNAIDSIRDSFHNAQPIPDKIKVWYLNKIEEIKKDSLLQAIREWRRQDFHGFEKLLVPIASQISQVGMITAENGPVIMSVEGAYRIINIDTPNERRVLLEQGVIQTKVQLINPPFEHRGEQIVDKNPVKLLELALDFYKNLVFEFKKEMI